MQHALVWMQACKCVKEGVRTCMRVFGVHLQVSACPGACVCVCPSFKMPYGIKQSGQEAVQPPQRDGACREEHCLRLQGPYRERAGALGAQTSAANTGASCLGWLAPSQACWGAWS